MANALSRPSPAPTSGPNTHNSLLPDFSQFFIHSAGTTTVAAAIFPSLVTEARMCSTRARGQRGVPPTGNAGSCKFGFRFPAPPSSPPCGSLRPSSQPSGRESWAPLQSDYAGRAPRSPRLCLPSEQKKCHTPADSMPLWSCVISTPDHYFKHVFFKQPIRARHWGKISHFSHFQRAHNL